jgi:hypothetical protein
MIPKDKGGLGQSLCGHLGKCFCSQVGNSLFRRICFVAGFVLVVDDRCLAL